MTALWWGTITVPILQMRRVEVKEAAVNGHGNCLFSIPFSWDLPPFSSIHLLIVGAVILCNYPASWS